MAQLSPGVQVNEIDLSIVVPVLGNATAAFAGEFTKGPSDKYLTITNGEELISNYGYPTNANYNDWFQAYNFLQYANKLLVSRAVDATGTWTATGNTVSAANEMDKVEVANVPSMIEAGSIIKFSGSTDEYKVLTIEDPEDAVAQVTEITITSAVDGAYGFNVNGTAVAFNAVGSTTDLIAAALNTAVTGTILNVTSTVLGAVITITAVTPGVDLVVTNDSGTMTIANTVDALAAQTYELVLETVTPMMFDIYLNDAISVKDSALNAIVDAPTGTATYVLDTGVIIEDTPAGTVRTAAELKLDADLIQNEETYEVEEMSIEVFATTKLKFMAKSSGVEMNGIQIAIAREADFETGKTLAFDGVALNDWFETKPSEASKEIAIMVRQGTEITGAYVVSTVPGSKDYRNKSNYVEDVINKYDDLLYVKDNTTISELPNARLFKSVRLFEDALGKRVLEKEITNYPTLVTSNGSDGVVDMGDIEMAYGNVAENTIFGNKEDIDVDIVIANEQARVVAGTLASERADCIAFIAPRFEDIVGLKSAVIVQNLVADVLDGELNTGGTANSFSAYFGNYKYQYDKFNDKFRWVSVAGDIAGLRADTNTQLNTWWASAGIDRGQIKNAEKIAFNPNQGQRDVLYKNKVNPVVSFPGQGNAIVWGQKTLQTKPSAFDRINVRGLFNTLERSISRMAKYYLFEFNDIYTRNRFVATIKPFLESVQAGRGVYDFYVRCDETNNTAQVIDSNQFIADIAVKPTRVAEFITLNFIAVGTGVDFKEIFV